MTEQDNAYFADSYLFTVHAEVVADGVDESGVPWIAVSPNIFHPRGGGQPADAGTVDGVPVAVDRNDAGLVTLALHPGAGNDATSDTSAAAAQPAPTGGERVRTTVAATERMLHAALHTAGHVLGFVGEERGWSHTGHSHHPGQARLDFDPGSVSEPVGTPEERDALRAELQARMDGLIARGGVVSSETAADGMRTVTIEGVNAEPCGGTHVRDLGCLAGVRILDLKVKRGALKIRYEASHAESPPEGGDNLP